MKNISGKDLEPNKYYRIEGAIWKAGEIINDKNFNIDPFKRRKLYLITEDNEHFYKKSEGEYFAILNNIYKVEPLTQSEVDLYKIIS